MHVIEVVETFVVGCVMIGMGSVLLIITGLEETIATLRAQLQRNEKNAAR